MFDSYKNNNC